MRKPGLFIVSAVALATFVGLSTSALAHIDPDCDGDPYPNDFAVLGFDVDTPDSNLAHANSAVNGQGVACGSDIHGLSQGVETLNDRADIQVARGVETNPAPNPSAGLNDGDFVGTAQIDVSTYVFFLGGALHVEDENVVMRVDTPTGNPHECPLDAVACYRGDAGGLAPGHGWIYVTEDAEGRQTLTIDRFFQDVTGEPAGLTQIDSFDLCAYAGTSGTVCGDSSRPFVQKNGDAAVPGCNNRNGLYGVTVTNRGGETSPRSVTCVEWAVTNSAAVPEQEQPEAPGSVRKLRCTTAPCR